MAQRDATPATYDKSALEPASDWHRAGGWSATSLVTLALGLGCYLGWQTIDISPTLFPEPSEGVADVIWLCGYTMSVLFMLLLAILGVLTARRGSLLESNPLLAAVTLGTVGGTALLYGCGWLMSEPLIAGVVAGKLFTAASAGYVVLWGDLLCRTRFQDVLACVALAYFTNFGICLISADLGDLGSIALRCVLPILSTLLMVVLRPEASHEADASNGLRDRWLPWRLLVGIGLFGAVFTLANHLSETKTSVSTELYTLFAGIAVSAAIALAAFLALRSRRRLDFAFLYRLLTPLAIGALLLTMVLQAGYQRYEALAIGFAWSFFRVFTWTMWSHVGSASPDRGACVFAAGQIVLTLVSTLAELLCSCVNITAMPIAVPMAGILFVAVVTSTLLMNERSLALAIDPGKRQHDGADFIPSASASASPKDMPKPPLDPACVTPDQVLEALVDFGVSPREAEIALHVLRGENNVQISDAICVTESTLRTHLRNIYAKVEVHSRGELISLVRSRL